MSKVYTSLQDQIIKSLTDIDRTIRANMHTEQHGLLNGIGGVALYFGYRFLLDRDKKFHNLALEALEQNIEKSNCSLPGTTTSLGEPLVSSFWLINHFISLGLLDKSEGEQTLLANDLINNTLSQYEFKNNFHDLFYGFIGKTILLLEQQSSDKAYMFINDVVNVLIANRKKRETGCVWLSPEPFYPSDKFKYLVNYGIPHGSLGILLFLLKSRKVFYSKSELDKVILEGFKDLVFNIKQARFNLPYQYGDTESGFGKLGWCYGDLAIAYALLRFNEEFNDNEAHEVSLKLLSKSINKQIHETGVRKFEKYSYFDLCLCHGISSIVYMYDKIYKVTGDNSYFSESEKWTRLLLSQLRNYLEHRGQVLLDESIDRPNKSMGFLNGLSGVGLVLLSKLNPSLSNWDKLLLLDRPGRE